jgi:hypothetical protein
MSLKSRLRRIIYANEKLAQRRRFAHLPTPAGDWPILLGISFPKSGTHLLDQILLGFAKVAPFSTRLHSFYAEYDGDSGRRRSAAETLAWLDALRPLDVASAHLFALPATVERILSRSFVPYFIYRDPRDIVVSHVFYVTDMEPRHVHHDYYASLPDIDARLKVSILGRPDIGIEFPDIAGRFAPYVGWLDHAEVMAIQFEDLVADRGRTLGLILDHFLARVPLQTPRQTILDALDASINPRRSPTFRSGKAGEWRKYFTAEHKRIFKDVAGGLLVRLGYEKDDDW